MPPSIMMLVLLVVMVWPASPVLAGEPASKRSEELADLRQRISAVQARLRKTEVKRDELRDALRKSERAIGQIAMRIRGLDASIRQLDEAIDANQSQIDLKQLELRRHFAHLADQLRVAYAMGDKQFLKMLLNEQDPAQMDRLLAYYGYLHRARAGQISAVRDRVLALRKLQSEVLAQRAKREQDRAALARERSALDRTIAQRGQLLSRIEADLGDQRARLERLRRDERQLSRLVADLNKALGERQSGKRFAQLRGKLPWPVSGKLRARFGQPRGLGDLRWQGTLIGAAQGSEVLAVADGQVVFADWMRGFGLLTIIDHGGGYMTLYAHNQSLYQQVGAQVSAGQAIASVGHSGGQRQSALYFEIRRKGKPVDPIKWCRRRSGGHGNG